jgi:prevent-host-death family protein
MKLKKKSYTIYETRTNLSSLLKLVSKGEEVIISHGQTPIAKIIPLEKSPTPRVPGSGKGSFQMAEDFDAPLPEELSKFFK